MKKLLLSVLAISALVACSKSDVIEMPQSQAIKFGSAFVDNSTKAAYDPIDPTWEYNRDGAQFYVWGKLTPEVPVGTTAISTNIFNGTQVVNVKSGNNNVGNTWFYSSEDIQYWIPSVNYNFAAIAGIGNAATDVTRDGNLMPASISYDASTQKDLVYATAEAEGKTSANNEVKFTFSHLLSKVKFTFVNNYPTNSSKTNLYLKVSDIKIVDAYKKASYVIGDLSPWTLGSSPETYTQNFGISVSLQEDAKHKDFIAPGCSSVSEYERLMIPASYNNTFKISFKAQVYLLQGDGGAEGDYTEITALQMDYPSSSPLTVNQTITLNPANSYNFRVELGGALEPIKFSVENLNGWTPDANYTGKIN